MFIMCVCLTSIDVQLDDFGTTYFLCPDCGREYEVNADFSLAVDIEEEGE